MHWEAWVLVALLILGSAIVASAVLEDLRASCSEHVPPSYPHIKHSPPQGGRHRADWSARR